MEALITGFEGYGGRSDNPSGEIATALNGTAIGGAIVHGRVLPVTNHNLRENIVGLIDELEPDIILCLGLAPGEKMIRLERIAANYSKFDIKDNAGEVVHGPINPDGPVAFDSTLPMEKLMAAVQRCGIPARVSNTAGTFLCNAVLYHALEHCSLHFPRSMCGFIHLPYMPSQVTKILAGKGTSMELEQRSDLASMSLDLQIEAVKAIVKQLAV